MRKFVVFTLLPTGILITLPFCSSALLRSNRPAPVLHSVLDKAAPPDLSSARFIELPDNNNTTLFFDPHDTSRSPTRQQVHHRGNVTTITGACFLFAGLLAFGGAAMAGTDHPSGTGQLVLLDLSHISLLVGSVLLVTGMVISSTHKPPKPSRK